MSAGIFDDELFSGLFGDEIISDVFSSSTKISNYIQFEIALTKALKEADLISEDVARVIVEACETFQPNPNDLQSGVARDGLAVPAFVKQLKDHIGGPEAEFLHFGATSQDLIDTSLMLSLKLLNREFSLRIKVLIDSLDELNHRFGSKHLMGRTRMQAALPIEVKDRVFAWSAPLSRQLEKLELLSEEVAVLHLGGAVGTRGAFGEKGDMISHRVATILELNNPPKALHNQRDNLANYANWLSLVTGGLGKMGQDMCLMAQQGIDEITFSNAGGSSAMPHKQNPVLAETLVALSRFNAVQLSGLHHAMIHEQERSGAAWTLEWMILPQMCAATASSLNNAQKLVGFIARIGTPETHI
ncbi:MAG: 3-carboxy-cis,cis-muconate cycloisomerase [Hyphomicrobiales bacterium]